MFANTTILTSLIICKNILSIKEDSDYNNFERYNNDIDNPLYIMQNNNFTNLFQDNLFDKIEWKSETEFEAQNNI